MNEHDQIADEAADQIVLEWRGISAYSHPKLKAIIRTAIEKALRNERIAHISKSHPALNPHASERKEGDATCPSTDHSVEESIQMGSEAAPTFDPKAAAIEGASKSFSCVVCKRGANEAGILHRVSRKGDTRPVIWICHDHFNYEDWESVKDNNERLARRVAHVSEPFPKNREEMKATHKAQHDAIDDAMGKET